MVRIGNALKILVRKPEEKRPLERPGRRQEDNIKMDLKDIGYEGVNLVLVYDNEPLVSIIKRRIS
jgi:hypothetical protein